MRVVAVVVLIAAGFVAGASLVAGSASASHRVASGILQNATGVSWSPDGRQLGYSYVPFSKANGGSGRSWIVRRSSSARGDIHTVLATRKGYSPVPIWWAADGRILFTSGQALYSVGVQGGKPKQIVAPDCEASDDCGIWSLTLSPNREVAAVATCDCQDPGGLLELVRLQPGQVSAQMTQIQEGAFVGFSPDSSQLVYSGASGLMALPLGGGNPVPLAQSGIPGASLVPSDATEVQWSHDGNWVAYDEDSGTDFTETLDVVPTTGPSPPRELAACSRAYTFGGICLDFSWSHASTTLAYDYPTNQTYTGSRTTFHFMTVRPDGTHLTNLLQHGRLTLRVDQCLCTGSGEKPQWSPDDSRLVFLASRPRLDLVEAWTIRANGHNLTRLN